MMMKLETYGFPIELSAMRLFCKYTVEVHAYTHTDIHTYIHTYVSTYVHTDIHTDPPTLPECVYVRKLMLASLHLQSWKVL